MIECFDRPFIEASNEELTEMMVNLLKAIDPHNNVRWTDVSDEDRGLYDEMIYERILRN